MSCHLHLKTEVLSLHDEWKTRAQILRKSGLQFIDHRLLCDNLVLHKHFKGYLGRYELLDSHHRPSVF